MVDRRGDTSGVYSIEFGLGNGFGGSISRDAGLRRDATDTMVPNDEG